MRDHEVEAELQRLAGTLRTPWSEADDRKVRAGLRAARARRGRRGRARWLVPAMVLLAGSAGAAVAGLWASARDHRPAAGPPAWSRTPDARRAPGAAGLAPVPRPDGGAPPPRPRLPIEALGPPGTTETVTLELPGSASRAAGLDLVLHGLSMGRRASARVNGGAWIALDDAHLRLPARERRFGGVGGPLATVRAVLPLPVGALRPGPNQIAFRFDGGDPWAFGFRVVRLDLVDGRGNRLLGAGFFDEDRPTAWRPLLTAPAEIAAGARLWRSAPLVDPATRAPLRATCADCHAGQGEDLQHFGYSSRAIVEAAQRFGLTAADGARIASHVRSLRVPIAGRPWDPPFQPGPASRGGWAAGAGFHAVLDEDREIARHLGRDGAPDAAVLGAEGHLDLRATPIALPLPDWAGWLPRLHPKDGFDGAFARAAPLPDPSAPDAVARFDAWGDATRRFLEAEWLGADRCDFGQRVVGLRRWQVVRLWEATQGFGAAAGSALAAASRQAWPFSHPFVADVGPIATRAPRRCGGIWAELPRAYLSAAWDHLAAVLHAGGEPHTARRAVPWELVYKHQGDLLHATGRSDAVRHFALLARGTQIAAASASERGWSFSLAAPHFLAFPDWETPFWTEPGDHDLRRALLDAYLPSWIDALRAVPPPTFRRCERGVCPGRLPGPDHVPVARGWGPLPDGLMHMVRLFHGWGVDCAALQSIADWGAAMWPRGDWGPVRPRCP